MIIVNMNNSNSQLIVLGHVSNQEKEHGIAEPATSWHLDPFLQLASDSPRETCQL